MRKASQVHGRSRSLSPPRTPRKSNGRRGTTDSMLEQTRSFERLRTGIAFDHRTLKHTDPSDDKHPECPERLTAIMSRLQAMELLSKDKPNSCLQLPPVQVGGNNSSDFIDVILAVHGDSYIEWLEGTSLHPLDHLKTESETLDSVYLCQESWLSSEVAAKSACQLAEKIALGELENGFALVRPPGHHASSNTAGGFCFLNNVAIATRYLQRKGLAKKIAIIDWDVHHGNGTQEIFLNDENVCLISLHRYDDGTFYPGSPLGDSRIVGGYSSLHPAAGKNINIAWNGSGLGDSDYLAAFYRIVLPVIAEFSPDMVMVSAGFDAAAGDPIGDCKMTPQGYAQLTHILMGAAPGGKVMLCLEGGYNISVVAKCAESCIRTLLGCPPISRSSGSNQQQSSPKPPSKISDSAIQSVIKNHCRYWKCLRPFYYPLVEEATRLRGDVFTFKFIREHFWTNSLLEKHLNFSLLPIMDRSSAKGEEIELVQRLKDTFEGLVYGSQNLFARKTKTIVVIAHEESISLQEIGESNLSDGNNAFALYPYLKYHEEAIKRGYGVVDITLPSLVWKLRQNQASGSEYDLDIMTELFIDLWDSYLSKSSASSVIFVTSGLSSYCMSNLLERRPDAKKKGLSGVVVLSPTLFLPLMLESEAEWYSLNSMVFVPTKKPIGQSIKTPPSFGSCVSSGSDDPLDLPSAIMNAFNMIFSFIEQKVKR